MMKKRFRAVFRPGLVFILGVVADVVAGVMQEL